ncbi:MAG: electron transport complex subunit E [Alphaproteobacteria bacterium]|nr:electron transport complex subunit E [Alphaproteobacteria bacterium]MBF0249372.1 electron transport complex subunit E [Alphaproteobacteria bacterium]
MTDDTPLKPVIDYRAIARDGLWTNNVVFGQLLALCPLLAVTGTASNGLGMGLATTVVLVTSGLSVAALRMFIPADVRIPVFVLVIATLVTIVDMAMNAWVHELHKVLGLFIPLIVTNCAILGRAEIFASKQPIGASALDGLMMGLGFTAALVVLGVVREILGAGTLFAGAALLLGNAFKVIEINIPAFDGVLLFALPPGGFVMLGFLLAGKRVLDEKLSERKERDTALATA